MSKIEIERTHNLGVDEARTKVSTIEASLKEKYGVNLAWRGNVADVKGTGVSGTLMVEETRIAVNLKLGLMLRPLAGKIREALERGVDRALRGS